MGREGREGEKGKDGIEEDWEGEERTGKIRKKRRVGIDQKRRRV